MVDRPAGGLVGRGHRPRRCRRSLGPCSRTCPRSSRSRPMPAPPRRSISTAWSATTICAPSRSRATCQINLTPQGRARPGEPRDRARHPPAARGARRARRHQRSRWSSRRRGRRCWRRCSPRSTAPTPRPAARSPRRSREAFASGALHRRRRQFLRRSRPARLRASSSTRTISSSSSVEEGDVYDTIAHPQRRRDRRLFAPRRRPPADPDPHRALAKGDRTLDERGLTTPIPANVLPGDRGVVELGDVVRVDARAAPPSRSSATTAAPPRW